MVTEEYIKKLEKRIERLEKENIEKRKNDLNWALSQFRYMKKDKNQRKALDIIENELKFRM